MLWRQSHISISPGVQVCLGAGETKADIGGVLVFYGTELVHCSGLAVFLLRRTQSYYFSRCTFLHLKSTLFEVRIAVRGVRIGINASPCTHKVVLEMQLYSAFDVASQKRIHKADSATAQQVFEASRVAVASLLSSQRCRNMTYHFCHYPEPIRKVTRS
jgi:hypothetical protein